MNMQQINLYRKNSGNDISRQSLLLAVPAMLLLLAASSGFDYWRITRLNDSIEEAQRSLSAEAARIASLQEQINRQQVSPRLSAEVARTEEKLQAVRRISQLLDSEATDQLRGFSRFFQALALHTPAQLWLSGISIDFGAPSMTLQGATQQAEQVAGFLQALEKAAAFKGRRFSSLTM